LTGYTSKPLPQFVAPMQASSVKKLGCSFFNKAARADEKSWQRS
jgi:hypothetical protein